MREQFILYRRSDGGTEGKTFYVSFWSDEAKRYISRRSVASLVSDVRGALPPGTVPTAKAGARRIVEAWLRHHEPAPVRGRSVTLLDYLSAFWADDGAYATGRKARGRPMSATHLANQRGIIKGHVKPYLDKHAEGIALTATTGALIEGMVMDLYTAGKLTPRTINTVRQAVTVPLAEAARLGLITVNPAANIAKLAETVPQRDILSVKEAKAFFARAWGDPRYYAINLLAATTGMRLGECLGLQAGDIGDDEIRVSHNWQVGEGLKAPKWGSSRVVPLPAKTGEIVRELAKRNPWGDGFVFFGRARGIPMSKVSVDRDYRLGIVEAGIPEAERVKRGLTFHGWRHWYVSMLRGGIPDHSLRALTGHKTEAMTERYTEIPADARAAVAVLAGQLV
jgi:integrase